MRRQYTAIMFPILLAVVVAFPVSAQWRDLKLPEGNKQIEIPFTYENNFIIVKVVFNGVMPLRFIFDTGAEHTIVTRREITDLLQINYAREIPIQGADRKTILLAYLVHGMSLKMGNMIAYNRNMLVLDEDYFRFEEYAGLAVHGIIGADMFRRFIVRIDYRKKKIILSDPAKFRRPGRRFARIPIEIYQSKPYITTRLSINQKIQLPVKLLIDSGANMALLLHTNSHESMALPDQTLRTQIGMGLSGMIEGYLGRVEHMELDEFDLRAIRTNFQDLLPSQDTVALNQRNGILGNDILSRFDLVIDYIRENIYLAPNRKFKKKFRVDRSGLFLASTSGKNKRIIVHYVAEGTPAEEAGLRTGDKLLRINGTSTTSMKLEDAFHRFQRKAGQKVRIEYARDGQRYKTEFRLRDLI